MRRDKYDRMNGLVNTFDLSAIWRSCKSVYIDLENEGFEHPEIVEFLQEKVKKHMDLLRID